MASNGSDAGGCSQTAPCATFTRADQMAAAGATVHIAPGTYPAQKLVGSSKGGARVVFSFAPGAQISGVLPGIWQNVALVVTGQDIDISGLSLPAPNRLQIVQASNVVVRNPTIPYFEVVQSSHVDVLGGSVGPIQNDASKVIESDQVTVDGVYFHDYTLTIPGTHMECLHAWGVTNFSVKRSKFFNCAIMDLFISNFTGPDMNGINIENNWFDKPGSHDPSNRSFGFYGLSIGSVGGRSANNVRIAYNSIAGGLDIGGNGASYSNWSVIANVGTLSQFGCYYGMSSASLTYRYNVWSNAKCGSTDKQAPLGFVDTANFDLHLLPGSAAIDAGDPTSYPPTDIDGQSRPRGAGPDAGSDET